MPQEKKQQLKRPEKGGPQENGGNVPLEAQKPENDPLEATDDYLSTKLPRCYSNWATEELETIQRGRLSWEDKLEAFRNLYERATKQGIRDTLPLLRDIPRDGRPMIWWDGVPATVYRRSQNGKFLMVRFIDGDHGIVTQGRLDGFKNGDRVFLSHINKNQWRLHGIYNKFGKRIK